MECMESESKIKKYGWMAKIRSVIIDQGLLYFIGLDKIKTPKLTWVDFRIFKVKCKF